MRNHILPAAVKQLGILYRQKAKLYKLRLITGEQITYGDSQINLETVPIMVIVKGKQVEVVFNILLLGNDKAVLRMPQLRDYNPRIDWVTGQVKIQETQL